jgi:hypothetical protein
MKQTLSLVGMFFILIIFGCSTTAVNKNDAINVSEDRIINKSLTIPDSTRDTKVIFVRDSGFGGSGCYIFLYYQNERIAKLETSEKVSFYFKEGKHFIGVAFGEKGLCSMSNFEFKYMVTISKDKENTYRIMTSGATVQLLPSQQ